MLELNKVMNQYTALTAHIPLKPIENDEDYVRAVGALDALLDAGVTSQDHPLADLLALLGGLIIGYEDREHAPPEASPAQVLRFLMDQHGLAQSDLPEVGSQGVVSEILAGKRSLNVRQIRMLAQRFAVSPAVFLN